MNEQCKLRYIEEMVMAAQTGYVRLSVWYKDDWEDVSHDYQPQGFLKRLTSNKELKVKLSYFVPVISYYDSPRGDYEAVDNYRELAMEQVIPLNTARYFCEGMGKSKINHMKLKLAKELFQIS